MHHQGSSPLQTTDMQNTNGPTDQFQLAVLLLGIIKKHVISTFKRTSEVSELCVTHFTHE